MVARSDAGPCLQRQVLEKEGFSRPEADGSWGPQDAGRVGGHHLDKWGVKLRPREGVDREGTAEAT